MFIASFPLLQWNKSSEKSESGCIEEGRKTSFILPMSSLPKDDTAWCQKRTLSLWFLPWGKMRAKWALGFPMLVAWSPGGPLPSCPMQNTAGDQQGYIIWGQSGTTRSRERGDGNSQQPARGSQKSGHSPHWLADSTKRPVHEPFRTTCLQNPQSANVPCMPCAWHPTCPCKWSMWGPADSTQILVVGMDVSSRLDSAGLDWAYSLETSGYCPREQELEHPVWLFRIKRRHTVLRLPP